MQLFAFRGTRFDPSNGNPGQLAAPPFDQINSQVGQRLREEPRNFAHLTRPDPSSADPHQLAADTQRHWLDQGILLTEEVPSLYLYETRLTTGGTRLGLCGLIGLGASPIRPHERTVSRTVEERLDLVRKVRSDLEPIFLLCDDPGTLNAELEADREGIEWLATYRDEFNHLHSIAAIQTPDRIEHYQQLIDGQAGLIADGHHRYKVAGLYAEESGAVPGSAAACKLVIIVSLRSPHLTIDPIHRATRSRVDVEALRPYVSETHSWQGKTGSGLARAVTTTRQPAIGIWVKGGDPEVWTLDREAILRRTQEPVPPLSVTLLHSLFGELGWEDQAAVDGTITYHTDPESLFRDMASGELELSFWLPPMSAEEFSEALNICELLPPKSTRFLPKLASGLVWVRHDTELL